MNSIQEYFEEDSSPKIKEECIKEERDEENLPVKNENELGTATMVKEESMLDLDFEMEKMKESVNKVNGHLLQYLQNKNSSITNEIPYMAMLEKMEENILITRILFREIYCRRKKKLPWSDIHESKDHEYFMSAGVRCGECGMNLTDMEWKFPLEKGPQTSMQ